jgi:hypothetical protein
MCCPGCHSCGVMESSIILLRLRVILVFRDIIYVIIVFYLWHLVISEHFLSVCVEQLILGIHTMNTWFWHKNRVWQLEEEFLVDKNEVRDSEVCGRMWHMSKSQNRSFEAGQKSATLEHSRMEVGEYLYGLHCGFARTSCGYNINMGHCGSLN